MRRSGKSAFGHGIVICRRSHCRGVFSREVCSSMKKEKTLTMTVMLHTAMHFSRLFSTCTRDTTKRWRCAAQVLTQPRPSNVDWSPWCPVLSHVDSWCSSPSISRPARPCRTTCLRSCARSGRTWRGRVCSGSSTSDRYAMSMIRRRYFFSPMFSDFFVFAFLEWFRGRHFRNCNDLTCDHILLMRSVAHRSIISGDHSKLGQKL